ncbi:GD25886 [Drosophila simulans]|uniref:GD25886 n=1 Tax=Drosophila simulans TaxID=7240 RepID=B4QBP3_DROSI|nr:GD25886 [Drosophila simulans]
MAPGQDAEHKKGARSTGNRFMVLDKDVDMDMGRSSADRIGSGELLSLSIA